MAKKKTKRVCVLVQQSQRQRQRHIHRCVWFRWTFDAWQPLCSRHRTRDAHRIALSLPVVYDLCAAAASYCICHSPSSCEAKNTISQFDRRCTSHPEFEKVSNINCAKLEKFVQRYVCLQTLGVMRAWNGIFAFISRSTFVWRLCARVCRPVPSVIQSRGQTHQPFHSHENEIFISISCKSCFRLERRFLNNKFNFECDFACTTYTVPANSHRIKFVQFSHRAWIRVNSSQQTQPSTWFICHIIYYYYLNSERWCAVCV